MNIKPVIAAIGAGLLAAACATENTADSDEMIWDTVNGRPSLIIAHRGASGYLPEHTLESYALAIEQGADIIESDLVITKDGILVARHDRYLSTTTNITVHPEFADRKRVNPDPNGEPREDWWVEDFTLAEIKTLRARQPREGRSKKFDDQYEIPTLEEMLTLIEEKVTNAKRPVGVYPEMKHPAYFERIGLDFEAPLLAALKDFDAGPVFIQSLEPEILKRLKGKTDSKLVQLMYPTARGDNVGLPFHSIKAYADGIAPSKDMILTSDGYISSFFGHAQMYGLFVHIRTHRNDEPYSGAQNFKLLFDGEPQESCLNSAIFKTVGERELCLFYIYGVDGIFTDFPDTAVAVRNSISKQ